MAQNKLKTYELTVITILSPTSTRGKENLKEIEGKIKKIGKIDKKESWGEKKLAYPIKKNQNGFYYFFQFNTQPSEIANLDKYLKLNENVIRHLIVISDKNKRRGN